MKKTTWAARLAALKPRNPFAVLARRRAAGAHGVPGLRRRQDQKDLLQRLREAGL